MERGREILRGREKCLRSDKINKRKAAPSRKETSSLIDYAGWEVLGVYPEVKGKTNLHPLSVGPICGCVIMDFEGFNRWAQPGRILSVGISIKWIVQSF